VFVNEITTILTQSPEISIYVCVVTINTTIQRRIYNVNPFAFSVPSLAVYNLRKSGHIKGAWRVNAIVGYVFMLRKVDSEISIRFRSLV
jgi:hypothetical protein